MGGVCVLALVAGLVFFSVRRNRKKLQQQQYQAGQATSTYAPQEIAGAPVPEFGTTEVKEIYTHQAGSGSQDVGRSNYYVPPPVELQGDVVGPDGAPGVGSRWQW